MPNRNDGIGVSACRAAILAATLILPTNTAYGAGPGTTSADFLSLYSDARPAALGGAYTALSDDAAGMDFNPAGLTSSMHREIAASYIAWFDDATFQHISYTNPIALSDWAWGVSYLNFDGGDFVRTNELGLPSGGRVQIRDDAVAVGVAADFGARRGAGKEFSAGLAFKYINRELGRYSASAWAFDAGLLYRTPVKNLTLGASILNVGSSITFISDDEELPLTVRGGLAWKTWLEDITIVADAVKVVDEDVRFSTGVEADVVNVIKLRAGWNTDDSLMKGWSLGAGFSVLAMTFDYAYLPYDVLGATHRVTASVRFGGPTKPEIYKVPLERAPTPSPPEAQPASRGNNPNFSVSGLE